MLEEGFALVCDAVEMEVFDDFIGIFWDGYSCKLSAYRDLGFILE